MTTKWGITTLTLIKKTNEPVYVYDFLYRYFMRTFVKVRTVTVNDLKR
jgi:hypothetical protein